MKNELYSRRRMGLKLLARTKAFVSSVKTLHYEVTWLVLPLLDNGGKIYKKRWKENIRISVGWENKWKRSTNNQIRVSECQHAHARVHVCVRRDSTCVRILDHVSLWIEECGCICMNIACTRRSKYMYARMNTNHIHRPNTCARMNTNKELSLTVQPCFDQNPS